MLKSARKLGEEAVIGAAGLGTSVSKVDQRALRDWSFSGVIAVRSFSVARKAEVWSGLKESDTWVRSR